MVSGLSREGAAKLFCQTQVFGSGEGRQVQVVWSEQVYQIQQKSFPSLAFSREIYKMFKLTSTRGGRNIENKRPPDLRY